jgi:PAS domain S-box-containing protein
MAADPAPTGTHRAPLSHLAPVDRVTAFGSGLGARLLLIVAVAIVPGVGLALWDVAEHREEATRAVVSEARQIARTAADQQERLIEGARQLARSLAHLPALLALDGAGCEQAVSAVMKGLDLYANISVTMPDGAVFCSALPLRSPVTFADRPWFQQAVTQRAPVVSGYLIGRITGRPLITVAYPIVEPPGIVRAVINIGVDPDFIGRLLARAALPAGSTLTLVDREGVVLARHPDPERWIGKSLPEGDLREALLAAPGGVFEAPGIDDVQRLYAIAPLRSPGETQVGSVIVGVSEAVVFAASAWRRALSLWLLGLSALAAGLLAWGVGAVAVRRPVGALLDGAARLTAGERVRLGPRYPGGEVGQLARAFDDMAAALEARQEALREARDTLQTLVADAPLPIVALDRAHTVMLWNAAAERTFGWTAQEVVGGPSPLIPGGEQRAEFEAWSERVMRGESIHGVEVRGVTKDGTPVDLSLFASPLRDASGAIRGDILTYLDITARRQMEAERRLLMAALDAAANAVLITDREGHILWANPAVTRLTGFSARELLGQTPRLLKSPAQDPAFYADLWETILAGQVWHGELVNRRKDGSRYSEEQTVTPLRDERGEVTHFVAIKQDVTARKRAEESLRHTETLAAMGALLAGVAHELNNPLAVVRGQAEMLRHAAGAGPLADRAAKIDQAAERCARIVGSFLTLARQRPQERQEVRVNEVVREALELFAYQLRVATIEVALDLADALPALWADPHQLQQVVVNLVSNAHAAMREAPPPRRLTLTTRADPARTRISLEVADTGPGIPLEIQPRLFEPFFTTKPVGQGTGLGLSICQGIVEAHRGGIRLESPPGPGARFVVELPVGAPPARGPEPAAAPETPQVQGRAILVVDDEPDVVDLLAEILTAEGHQVDTAANGRVALDRIQARAYDLILTDLRMPELDGPGLYRELERRDGRLCGRVVFITGDALGPDVTELLNEAGRPCLGKPFMLEDVRRVVRQALGAQRPG